MEKEKLLDDILISDGTGKQIAQNVLKLLQDWNIEKNIVGLSFDTTSASTGRKMVLLFIWRCCWKIHCFGLHVSTTCLNSSCQQQ